MVIGYDTAPFAVAFLGLGYMGNRKTLIYNVFLVIVGLD